MGDTEHSTTSGSNKKDQKRTNVLDRVKVHMGSDKVNLKSHALH